MVWTRSFILLRMNERAKVPPPVSLTSLQSPQLRSLYTTIQMFDVFSISFNNGYFSIDKNSIIQTSNALFKRDPFGPKEEKLDDSVLHESGEYFFPQILFVIEFVFQSRQV